jgi:hypothetical protein
MKMEKPECQLMGENGNIFNLIGIASRTLKRAGLREQANQMRKEVIQSQTQSYDEALAIIDKYVDIC